MGSIVSLKDKMWFLRVRPSHFKRSLPPPNANVRKHSRGHDHHILHHKKYYLNNRWGFLRSIINNNLRTSKWHVTSTSWNCSSTMSLLETRELWSVLLVMVVLSNSIMFMPNFATIGQIIQKHTMPTCFLFGKRYEGHLRSLNSPYISLVTCRPTN